MGETNTGMPRASLDWDAVPLVAWECGGLVMAGGAPQPRGYCDQEATEAEYNPYGAENGAAITPESLRQFLAPLVDGIDDLSERLGQAFVVNEAATMSNGLGDGPATVHRWSGGSGDRSCRLEAWLCTGGDPEGDGLIALEDRRSGLALVVGCACGHPYVNCNAFTFGNSDGSSEWEAPPDAALTGGSAAAARVVEHFCGVAARTLFEQIH